MSKVLRDLVEVGQSVTVARGGPGGTLASNFLGGPGDRLSGRIEVQGRNASVVTLIEMKKFYLCI